MSTYSYSAFGSDGQRRQGEVEADDRGDAIRRLARMQLQLIELRKTGGNPRREAKARAEAEEAEQVLRLKPSQVVMFVEELADLLQGGIQLEPALAIMGRRKELSGVREVSVLIRNRLRDGDSLAQALRQSSPSFGEMFCNLVAAGEQSGSLGEVLERQAHYLASLQDLRNRVLFALIYPSFLVASTVAVVILFVSFLIPKLTELLDSTGSTLPAGAALLLHGTEFASRTWWIGLLALGGALLGTRMWIQTGENRVRWDRAKLNWPLIGPLFRSRFYVQFLETLSNIMANGLPLKSALDLTRRATSNLHLRTQLEGVIEAVADGIHLSEALARTREFPSLLLDMIVVGEEVGDLPAALARASTRYDKELNQRTEKISALVQPIVIVLMASLIGVLAYLMITAIFQTISGLG